MDSVNAGLVDDRGDGATGRDDSLRDRAGLRERGEGREKEREGEHRECSEARTPRCPQAD